MSTVAKVDVQPVTTDRWPDLVQLFGGYGATSGCWCMWFRVAPRTWSANGNDGNRAAMERIVASDDVPGLLAYEDGRPAGWVSVAPRPQFERIAGPPERASAGDEAVWSVVCFFIEPGRRGQGLGSALLAGAIDFARSHGAKVLEAYPIDRDGPISNGDAYTGPRSMYEKAGFRETGRFDRWAAIPAASGSEPKRIVRPPGRPVMRIDL